MNEVLPDPALTAEQEVRFARVERVNIAPTGKRFSCQFMEPGLISYKDVKGGVDLYRKESIEACLDSMKGTALTIGHPTKDVILSGDFSAVSHGTVDTVGYDQSTGWFTCEGTVETEDARNRIKEAGGVSAGYTVLERANGGTKGQIPYNQEIVRLKFHHLAIVPTPRVEEAEIRLNSKKPMNIIGKLIQKITGGAERSTDLTAETTIAIDGKPVSFADMIASQKERANAVHMVSPEDYIEHDGMRYNCAELMAGWKAANMRSNEAPAGETPEAKKAREDQERENAVAAETRKQESIKAQKAIDDRLAEERLKTEREERENAARGQQSFKTLRDASASGAQQALPEYTLGSSGSLDDGVALGRERYGKAPTAGRN